MTLTNINQANIGLDGFDPVSYFVADQPAQGDPSISATHDGVTYYFASAEHKAKFVADPAKYLPQYGGYCAIAVSEGKLFPVDPNTYKITDDKLYLFYNGELGNTKPQWEADEENRRASANDHWARGDVKPHE